MTKNELVEKLAEKTGFTKVDAQKSMDSLVEVITEALVNGDKVVLSGFGAFEVRDRAARTARNPQTGEEIKINASKTPAFKAGKTLKEAINK